MSTRARARLALVAAIALAAPAAGCEVVLGTCGEELADKGAARYTEGVTEDGVYRSSEWDPEELVEFAPGQIVRFEHQLGAVPRSIDVYVAASRTGDGAKIVLASGNEVEILSVDDRAVTLKNGTCSDFFILLVAEAGP